MVNTGPANGAMILCMYCTYVCLCLSLTFCWRTAPPPPLTEWLYGWMTLHCLTCCMWEIERERKGEMGEDEKDKGTSQSVLDLMIKERENKENMPVLNCLRCETEVKIGVHE